MMRSGGHEFIFAPLPLWMLHTDLSQITLTCFRQDAGNVQILMHEARRRKKKWITICQLNDSDYLVKSFVTNTN